MKTQPVSPIPPISRRNVVWWLKRLKPVARDADDALRFIEVPDAFEADFVHDAILTDTLLGEVSMIGVITTYHASSGELIFKPTIAEVMAQLPPNLAQNAIAFETKSDAVQVEEDIRGFCGHRTQTVVYAKIH